MFRSTLFATLFLAVIVFGTISLTRASDDLPRVDSFKRCVVQHGETLGHRGITTVSCDGRELPLKDPVDEFWYGYLTGRGFEQTNKGAKDGSPNSENYTTPELARIGLIYRRAIFERKRGACE